MDQHANATLANEGLRRRKHLILFGLLSWLPTFIVAALLIALVGERVGSLLTVVAWAIIGAVILVRYSNWHCPSCGQFFAREPAIGYPRSGQWLLSRTCRNCGYKI